MVVLGVYSKHRTLPRYLYCLLPELESRSSLLGLVRLGERTALPSLDGPRGRCAYSLGECGVQKGHLICVGGCSACAV